MQSVANRDFMCTSFDLEVCKLNLLKLLFMMMVVYMLFFRMLLCVYCFGVFAVLCMPVCRLF